MFQLAFYLFMEPGLHPTPAGHKGASQLPRTGCGEHCRSGRDRITQGCAHARLLYFRNDLGAVYCSAQLQVGVGHQAPRAPAVGSPKWAESRFIWRGGRKPTHAPMSRLLQGTSCAMQLSSEHASVLQPAAKWHSVEQCLERPGFGVNPSHPSQQGKLLLFSSPLLGIGRELCCPSPQRGGEASGIFQQHVAFVVQASVQPHWTSPLSARPRCPWRHPQQRCSERTAL